MPDVNDPECFTPSVNWLPPTGATIDRPLPWPIDLTCCAEYAAAIDTANAANTPALIAAAEAQMMRMAAAAIDLMYASTCFRFNQRCDWVRPCQLHTCCGGNLDGSYCSEECGRTQLNLRDWVSDDITAVLEIQKHDGTVAPFTVVSPGDYELDGSKLVPFHDGDLWPWPRQNRNDPFPEVAPTIASGRPTWRILVRHGREAPPSLLLAAGDLACNLFNACRNKPCDIPANAVSVSREGVTVQLETGLKAIPSVKMAVETYGNCKDLKTRSRIVDPAEWVVQ